MQHPAGQRARVVNLDLMSERRKWYAAESPAGPAPRSRYVSLMAVPRSRASIRRAKPVAKKALDRVDAYRSVEFPAVTVRLARV